MGPTIEIDDTSAVPPYEQIRDAVVAGVRSGGIATGTRLPSVRQLASDLGLAVNTVAKAYKALEAEGHVETRGRHGTVVLPPQDDRGQDAVQAAATRLAETARAAGLDIDAAVGVLRRAW